MVEAILRLPLNPSDPLMSVGGQIGKKLPSPTCAAGREEVLHTLTVYRALHPSILPSDCAPALVSTSRVAPAPALSSLAVHCALPQCAPPRAAVQQSPVPGSIAVQLIPLGLTQPPKMETHALTHATTLPLKMETNALTQPPKTCRMQLRSAQISRPSSILCA